VAAGAVARKLLAPQGIHVLAFTRAIGQVLLDDGEMDELMGGEPPADPAAVRERIYASAVRCPHPRAEPAMQEALRRVAEEKDSLGGVVEVRAYGLPAGLGEPVFHKLGALLGQAVLSVGAVKGIEFGEGFRLADLRGSQANDLFARDAGGGVAPATNRAGGLAGGISTGLPLVFRAAVKPTSSIGRAQQTVDAQGQPLSLTVEGRHDPCIVLRVVPVIEHMTNLVLLDLLLAHGTVRLLAAE
jgi:chorismate synthase